MKINWKQTLVFSVIIMITLLRFRDYLLLLYPWMSKILVLLILFTAAKIMGSLLEIIFSLFSFRFYIDDFLEELFIFIFLGFNCWLFILGAEKFIGGKVEYAIIPPAAYFLINSLYREGGGNGRKLV